MNMMAALDAGLDFTRKLSELKDKIRKLKGIETDEDVNDFILTAVKRKIREKMEVA